MVPDVTTGYIDPFYSEKTIAFYCNVVNPITYESYSKDPRYIAQKAEKFLKSSGLGDTAYFGPEAEFFVFNDLKYDSGSNFTFYEVDSSEGAWNTGRDENPNLAHKPRHKQGYFPLPPADSMHDVRTEMVLTMQDMGLTIDAQHQEVAPAQHEIDFQFDTMLKTADMMQWYKYLSLIHI